MNADGCRDIKVMVLGVEISVVGATATPFIESLGVSLLVLGLFLTLGGFVGDRPSKN